MVSIDKDALQQPMAPRLLQLSTIADPTTLASLFCSVSGRQDRTGARVEEEMESQGPEQQGMESQGPKQKGIQSLEPEQPGVENQGPGKESLEKQLPEKQHGQS